MIKYPEHIEKAIKELTDKGFAIVIFTPKELQGVNPSIIEEYMIKDGWEAIGDYKDPDVPHFQWENEIEEYPT